MRPLHALPSLAVCLGLAACAHEPKDHSARYAKTPSATPAIVGTGTRPGGISLNPGATGGGGTPVASGTLTLTPDRGHTAGNELLVITGATFAAGSQVTVGGKPAEVLEQSASRLVVRTPTGSGNVEVAVTTSGARQTGNRLYAYVPVTQASDYHFQANTDRWLVQVADADANGQPDLLQALSGAMNTSGSTGFANADQALTIVLQRCAQLYRNQGDGQLLPGGAPLSFQVTTPTFGRAPTAGNADTPGSKLDHNVMAIRNVGYLGQSVLTSGILGAAQFESQENVLIHHNGGLSASSGEPLGVFPDALVYFWNQSAIPPSRRTLEGLMGELSLVLAHEIGHSIGLDHVEVAPAAGQINVMSAVSTVNPANVYAFDQATFTSLLGWLPGTNRCSERRAWSPRQLLAAADAVVLGRPLGVAGADLELQVEQVLAGRAGLGYQRVAGLDAERAAERMTPGAPALLFLRQTPSGMALTGLGEAGGVDLTGRDAQEWADLIAAHRDLAARTGADYLRGSADLLVRSLDSGDARIRIDAWADLTTSPEVVAALTPAQVARVLEGLRAPSPAERAMAAQVLIHRADPNLAGSVLAAALTEDEPVVLAELAGALETGLGLGPAAERVKAALSLRPTADQARGAVVLAWLQDTAGVEQVTAGVGAQPAPSQLLRDALPALQANGLGLPASALTGF